MDVRLAVNQSPDDFEIIHGFLKLGSFKKHVMYPVLEFLKKNPSEMIFMGIRDYGLGFEGLRRLKIDVIRNRRYRFYQHVVDSNTSIGQVTLVCTQTRYLR